MKKRRKYEPDGSLKIDSGSIVIAGDFQCRYQDDDVVDIWLQFVKDFNPETVVLNGDMLDLESLSKYPTSLEHRLTVQADVDAAVDILKRLRAVAPKAEIYHVAGNHEQRLEKYLTVNAPELAGSPNLTIPEFLGLKELGIEYIEPYGRGVSWHGCLVYHGRRVSQHSAYSAKAEFFDAGTSLVMGHTTRLGSYYFTDRNGVHVAHEAGSLTRTDPEGAPPNAKPGQILNWQQGWAFGQAIDGHYSLYLAPVVNHKLVYNGKLYTANKENKPRGRGRPKKEDK